jgi:hypothetical protein
MQRQPLSIPHRQAPSTPAALVLRSGPARIVSGVPRAWRAAATVPRSTGRQTSKVRRGRWTLALRVRIASGSEGSASHHLPVGRHRGEDRTAAPYLAWPVPPTGTRGGRPPRRYWLTSGFLGVGSSMHWSHVRLVAAAGRGRCRSSPHCQRDQKDRPNNKQHVANAEGNDHLR